MKQIFKHPRTFVTGLAAVGIAPALATVAQADTEPFPAELTQLIAEAKALNIQVVEGPNKTFGTNVDLQTYYDNLVHKLQDLVIQAKTTKATNENAQNTKHKKPNSLRILTSIKSYKRIIKNNWRNTNKNWTLGNNNLRLMLMHKPSIKLTWLNMKS